MAILYPLRIRLPSGFEVESAVSMTRPVQAGESLTFDYNGRLRPADRPGEVHAAAVMEAGHIPGVLTVWDVRREIHA